MVVEEIREGVYAISDIIKVAIFLCEKYYHDDINPLALHVVNHQIIPEGSRLPDFRLIEVYDTIRWNARKGRPCRVVMFALEFASSSDEPIKTVAKELLLAIHTSRLFVDQDEFNDRKKEVIALLVKYENERSSFIKERGESAIQHFGTSYGFIVLEGGETDARLKSA
jgi:hypothetical protein